MGVYSNKEIKEAIERGHIVCVPFNGSHVNGSSIDVTLGMNYYRTDRGGATGVYNPFEENAVASYFGKVRKAEPHKEWCDRNGHKLFDNIPENHPIIVLEPGERILAHTQEFIGIKPPGTTSMQSRSTWGRNGVAVCFDAGWGDPGYINRWTMEVYNLNQRHSVVLPVGERIAQIVFQQTGEVDSDYSKLSGKYQVSADIEELINKWSPEQMLPRAYKDQRSKPLESS